MTPPRFAVVILAAGQGTRMRSDRHKVLHPIAGKPMLVHLLDTVESIGAARSVVVVGKGREQIEAAVSGRAVDTAVQDEQLGTAHAVSMAKAALAGFDGPVVILYGDTPFVRGETIATMLERLAAGDSPGVVVLAFTPADAKSYGRVILEPGSDRIAAMVEYKDATPDQRAVGLCNSGMMAAHARDLWRWLDAVGNDNAAGEYYLPDVVAVARGEGRHPVAIEAAEAETAGVNSRAELAELERDWQARRRREVMDSGVTLVDPDSVWFSADTVVGRDCMIEPHVFFGPGVSVGERTVIRGFSHLEGTTVGDGCEVGPFARLRPGAVMERGSKVGNFVEMKKAVLGEGAKANHLTYLGDATIGAKANIGAGTITCNYDGFFKYRTVIGAGAFIGSNSALVAPVTIGEGAIVGAGSVVTGDVPGDALGIARSDQRNIGGWAADFRAEQKAKKDQA
ncbi:bifunctional UDP-N-acetylglucosamine diphosphorylase/glucosamine-1-phosphate N-acetyltransferase GlmU [Sphingomonas sp. ASV193]|uniref:bifunctional UDP-N-acetylglucosamine diphosphorylase/glucosamine-1-phosphate N-acetyltransferase GlmU n=1 Tax=Sphingomonas sp. ASV193 TaxID=3144405 RepID=UPI0032E923E7